MSILLIDGYDIYNGTGTGTGLQSKWTTGSTVSLSLVSGRFGGQALHINNGSVSSSGYLVKSFSSAVSTGSIGFALRMTALPAADSANIQNVALFNGATGMIGLRVNSTGSITAYRNSATALGSGLNAGTALGTSATSLIAAGVWNYIEVEFVISDTVGAINVYLNGSSVLSVSGADTKTGTGTTVDSFVTGLTFGTTTTTASFDIDDIYVSNSGTRLGERLVETLYPTSDVAQGFARSAGSDNYALVDEAQANGDTDYVQGSAVGDLDTYGFGNLATIPTVVDAVQAVAFAEKTDAASRSIALRVNGNDGSNLALAATYSRLERLMDTNPSGGGAWDNTSVNAIQGGPKVTV